MLKKGIAGLFVVELISFANVRRGAPPRKDKWSGRGKRKRYALHAQALCFACAGKPLKDAF